VDHAPKALLREQPPLTECELRLVCFHCERPIREHARREMPLTLFGRTIAIECWEEKFRSMLRDMNRSALRRWIERARCQ